MPGRMQGMENFSWNEFLQKPTYVLNDAVAALIAEATSAPQRTKNMF
jgi:predicted NBD/HSP70 family sugar kinase